MATTVCIKLPEIPTKFSATLPGMGELNYIRDSLERCPRPSEMLLKFLNQMAPSMSPIYTMIKIIDVSMAMNNCISSVPKCITQMNPKPLLQCLEKLVKAIAALIPLIPPISYVRMVVDIISLANTLVIDCVDVLIKLDGQISDIKLALTQAQNENDTVLLEIAECAKQNLNQQAAGIIQVVQLLGKLIAAVMSIMDSMASSFPPLQKVVDKFKEEIGEFEDSIGAVSITDFPPLGAITEALLMLNKILNYVEMIGKAILGMPFTVQQLESWVPSNP